jgi:hypothetical protein
VNLLKFNKQCRFSIRSVRSRPDATVESFIFIHQIKFTTSFFALQNICLPLKSSIENRKLNTMKILKICLLLLLATPMTKAQALLIPMDDAQSDHLKAYGITFWHLKRGQTADWLLNYRGGSFLMIWDAALEQEQK